MDENGIFLNGNLIGTEPVPFTDSSTLQCGDQEFRVKLVQANANCPPELSLISSAVHIDLPIVQGKRPWGTALKKAVEAYEKGLSAVVREGRITELEVSDLNRVHARLGLLDQDTLGCSIRAVIQQLDRERGSSQFVEPDAAIEAAVRLGVSGNKDATLKSALNQHYSAYALNVLNKTGQPYVVNENFVTFPTHQGELVHLVTQASLMEERVFGSHYVGGYSGVSFRVAKGVRFNLGGVRGHRVSEREVVAVSRGQLSFTSGRILFLGQRKAFEVPWSKLMAVEPYFDGIQLFTRNRQRSPLMVYRDPEMSELAAMICSHYLN